MDTKTKTKVKGYINLYRKPDCNYVKCSLFPYHSATTARKEKWDGWERIKTICIPVDGESLLLW